MLQLVVKGTAMTIVIMYRRSTGEFWQLVEVTKVCFP